MGPQTPWVTGFLGNILIGYLEEHHPSLEKQIDYGRMIGPDWGSCPTGDAKRLLRDNHQWYPHSFLKGLIRACECLTRKKDLAYLATLDYFQSRKPTLPSVYEMICEMLQDVESTLALAGHWATSYTNYLKLQTCVRGSATGGEAVVLVHFEDFVHPVQANLQFVQGHLEGFPRLYGFVEECRSQEVYSQLRLQDIVHEFDGYKIETNPESVIIREKHSGRKIIEAEAVELGSEDLFSLEEPDGGGASREGGDGSQFPWSRGDRLPTPVVAPSHRRVNVFSGTAAPSISPSAPSHARTRQRADRAYRVTQGGVLEWAGGSWSLPTGRIFNAPYSRYDLVWREQPASDVREGESTPSVYRAKRLLGYLASLKDNQIRLLQYTAENRGLQEENLHLRRAVQDQHRFGQLIGTGPGMRQMFSLLERVSRLDTTILVTGETGTGKELAARAIHYNSPRKDRRFLAINCGALTETLLESELFGYERGAFTGAVARHEGRFEQADGGTLFLDEVGEISPSMQVKLLRVLEQGEIQRIGGRGEVKVDVRVIAATHQDLKSLMAQGRFRKDLYYRLNVVEVQIPPLRERREDIPYLAAHFLQALQDKLERHTEGFSPAAMQCLLDYSWPGNVRELRHAIERAMILAETGCFLLPGHFPREVRQSGSHAEAEGQAAAVDGLLDLLEKTDWRFYQASLTGQGSLSKLLKCIEGCIVQKAIREHKGNKSRAAKALKRSYRWLRRVEKGLEI